MSTTGRRDLPPGNRETLSALFRPPNSESRDDLIEASILVQKALASPGFPVSEAEMRASAERRTDRAPFDLAGLARQSAALIVAAAAQRALETGSLPGARSPRRRRSGHARGRGEGHGGEHPGRRTGHRSRDGSRLRGTSGPGLSQAHRRVCREGERERAKRWRPRRTRRQLPKRRLPLLYRPSLSRRVPCFALRWSSGSLTPTWLRSCRPTSCSPRPGRRGSAQYRR